jgi:hypothetical protein
MTTRPIRIAQTSTEVKKLYKQNGSVPSERQQRQLERAASLEKRAVGLREREERGKVNRKKREERERKEAASRRINGVGMATQMIGYSHTQAQLKKGMEAFLGYKKRSEHDRQKRELEVAKQLEAAVEEVSKEPWDDDTDDTFDIPEPSTRVADQFMDDDLDDETLRELHDQVVMSDPVEEPTEAPQPPNIASSASVAPSLKMLDPPKEDIDFLRLHGPVNKMIESLLEKSSEPLTELLSHDCSIDPAAWDPSPALLHKLNPPGLPPHRLRVKVGCAVTLLRDLNSSSQLSKSQHLQILRAEQERLECLVLDGQLQGTKTFLTKVSFAAKYRNEDNFPFQRIQFPIQVSKDFVVPVQTRKPSVSGFKKPTPSGQTLQSSNSSSKRPKPTPKAISQSNRNPSFKLPGLPASKSKPIPTSKPTLPPPLPGLDGWDDFLDTASQIARDLSSESSSPCKAPSSLKPAVVPVTTIFSPLPPLSTQDFDFSLEDLDNSPVLPREDSKDLAIQSHKCGAAVPQVGRPYKMPPQPSKAMDTGLRQPSKVIVPTPRPHNQLAPKRKCPEDSDQALIFAVPKKRAVAALTRRDSTHHEKRTQSPSTGPKQACNTVFTKSVSETGAKRSVGNPQTISMPSFSEFGLSTQEANSFFDDDDDLAYGSPPIAVQ